MYVFSQKDAETVASNLQKRDILAQPYHANMQPADKSLVHQRWASKKIQVQTREVIVARFDTPLVLTSVVVFVQMCRWSLPPWRSAWASTKLTYGLLSITPSASPSKITIKRVDVQVAKTTIHHSIYENMFLVEPQIFCPPGRDDSPADCIVFFGFMDIFRISTMVVMENTGQQKLQNMVAYCQNVDR